MHLFFQVQLAPLVGSPPPGDSIVAFRRFVTMEVRMGAWDNSISMY